MSLYICKNSKNANKKETGPMPIFTNNNCDRTFFIFFYKMFFSHSLGTYFEIPYICSIKTNQHENHQLELQQQIQREI